MTAGDAAALLARLPEPYLLLHPDGTVLAANPIARRILAIEDDRLPLAITKIVTDEAAGIADFLARCARTGTMLPGTLVPRSGMDRLECRGCALDGGEEGAQRLVLLRLDTRSASSQFAALTRTIEELRREAHQRRTTERALHETQRRTAFLAEASRVLGSSLDYEQTLRNVARMAVPDFADWCAVDLTLPDGGLERVAVEHPDPDRVRLAVELQQRYPPRMDAAFGVPAVVRTGRSEIAEEIPEGLIEAAAVDEEHLRLIRELRLNSYVVVPLATQDAVLGAITCVYAESGRVYRAADLTLLEDVGRRAATAIENARLVAAIEEARQRIEEQAGELEAQTEELQTQSSQLEEQAFELEHQLEHVAALNQALTAANERLGRAHTDSEHARQAAERASAAKSQFLAVMSHELRTPMNAILGFTDLLDAEISGPINDVQKSHLSRVRASAVHLLGLIDQVLSLARIEAGREEVFVEEVDVGAVVADVAAMMQPLAERRGLTLTIDVEPPLLHATSDAGKLRQILLNLIGNAIKFTDEGTVSLHVTASGEQLQVAIADTGRGIARDDMERIFDPFEQVDQTISRRAEGTGLGLPVSRELARLLGGEIVAVSEPGRGSTFTLRLPVTGPPPTAHTVGPAAS
jgi:signal transduction histidine kinase